MLALLATWIRLEWLRLFRYAFDTFLEVVNGYIVFLIVLFGMQFAISDSTRFGTTVDEIIAGFMVLGFVLTSYRRIGHGLVEESISGTLEQVAMCPLGLGAVLICRWVSYLSISLAFMVIQVVFMVITTGHWMRFDVVSLLPLLLLTYASGQGVGFVVGGLALVYKRVQNCFQLLGWTFFALTMSSPAQLPILKYLPVSHGVELIRRVIAQKESIWTLPSGDLAFLAAHGACYAVVGFAGFMLLERRARWQGSLGHS